MRFFALQLYVLAALVFCAGAQRDLDGSICGYWMPGQDWRDHKKPFKWSHQVDSPGTTSKDECIEKCHEWNNEDNDEPCNAVRIRSGRCGLFNMPDGMTTLTTYSGDPEAYRLCPPGVAPRCPHPPPFCPPGSNPPPPVQPPPDPPAFPEPGAETAHIPEDDIALPPAAAPEPEADFALPPGNATEPEEVFDRDIDPEFQFE